MKEEIRKAAVAGSFYPADAPALSREVRQSLAAVSPEEVPGEIVALVSPHAGYAYSGQVAAHAFKLVAGMKFAAVVVVAPSHRAYFEGASVYQGAGYETPLGLVPLEKELCQKLLAGSGIIRFEPQAHAREHSLEVQLPFLQETLGNFRLVPVVIGRQDFPTCAAVGKGIAAAAQGKKILLVASTDLSHFHAYEEAVKLDGVFLEGLRSFDPRRLEEDLQRGRTEACGGGPVLAVMVASKEMGANHARVLRYQNSGDVTGDRSGVVGYAAAVFYRGLEGGEQKEGARKGGISLGLTSEEKEALRQIALGTIERRLKRDQPPKRPAPSGALREKRGAFVSLHKKGRLRGCIGQIQAAKPLHQVVEEMALAAAFEDPRFEPVSSRDLADLELEISVLTPLRRVERVEEIEVGKHGLYIKKGYYSGLLLPQVAVECNWERTTFLEETCRKAGLNRNAWKEKDAEIYIFSADIF